MAEGEGNKPAISLLEQQEQKRRPAEPSITPAPYVQPYRPQHAVPPAVRQANISSNSGLTDTPLRSNVSYASGTYGRSSGHPLPGQALPGGALPSFNSPASTATVPGLESPGSFLSSTHMANMLAYTQQQLSQLQHVQTMLLQQMQALHQLQATHVSGGGAAAGGPAPAPGVARLSGAGTSSSIGVQSLLSTHPTLGLASGPLGPPGSGWQGATIGAPSPGGPPRPPIGGASAAYAEGLGSLESVPSALLGPRLPSGSGAAGGALRPSLGRLATAGSGLPPPSRPPQPRQSGPSPLQPGAGGGAATGAGGGAGSSGSITGPQNSFTHETLAAQQPLLLPTPLAQTQTSSHQPQPQQPPPPQQQQQQAQKLMQSGASTPGSAAWPGAPLPAALPPAAISPETGPAGTAAAAPATTPGPAAHGVLEPGESSARAEGYDSSRGGSKGRGDGAAAGKDAASTSRPASSLPAESLGPAGGGSGGGSSSPDSSRHRRRPSGSGEPVGASSGGGGGGAVAGATAVTGPGTETGVVPGRPPGGGKAGAGAAVGKAPSSGCGGGSGGGAARPVSGRLPPAVAGTGGAAGEGIGPGSRRISGGGEACPVSGGQTQLDGSQHGASQAGPDVHQHQQHGTTGPTGTDAAVTDQPGGGHTGSDQIRLGHSGTSGVQGHPAAPLSSHGSRTDGPPAAAGDHGSLSSASAFAATGALPAAGAAAGMPLLASGPHAGGPPLAAISLGYPPIVSGLHPPPSPPLVLPPGGGPAGPGLAGMTAAGAAAMAPEPLGGLAGFTPGQYPSLTPLLHEPLLLMHQGGYHPSHQGTEFFGGMVPGGTLGSPARGILVGPTAAAVPEACGQQGFVDGMGMGGAPGGGGGAVAGLPGGEVPGTANEPQEKPDGPGPDAPELETQLNANRKDLFVFPEDDEDDADDGEEYVLRRRPWYRRAGVLWFLNSVLVAIALTVVGMCVQTGKITQKAAEAEVFRWLYFVAGAVPVYWIVYVVVSWVFGLVEWIYFRENLTYLHNIKENSTALITMLIMLIWFQACFNWLWCDDPSRCSSSTYLRALNATWKTVLCIMLFTLANVLKAVFAKLSSMHFYRTAHFKKLKDSLEKEYYLQLLSVPRSRIIPQIDPDDPEAKVSPDRNLRTMLARPSTLMAAAGATLRRVSRIGPRPNPDGQGPQIGGGGGHGHHHRQGAPGGLETITGDSAVMTDGEAAAAAACGGRFSVTCGRLGMSQGEGRQSTGVGDGGGGWGGSGTSGGPRASPTSPRGGGASSGSLDVKLSRTICDAVPTSREGGPLSKISGAWVGFWWCGKSNNTVDVLSRERTVTTGIWSLGGGGGGGGGDSRGRDGNGGDNGDRRSNMGTQLASMVSITELQADSAAPPPPPPTRRDSGRGNHGGANGDLMPYSNGGNGSSPGNVTVVVMEDPTSPSGPGKARHASAPADPADLTPPLPPPPPPAPAPPAPPPPPPPLSPGARTGTAGSSIGGALGIVSAEPFLTQTSAYFDHQGRPVSSMATAAAGSSSYHNPLLPMPAAAAAAGLPTASPSIGGSVAGLHGRLGHLISEAFAPNSPSPLQQQLPQVPQLGSQHAGALAAAASPAAPAGFPPAPAAASPMRQHGFNHHAAAAFASLFRQSSGGRGSKEGSRKGAPLRSDTQRSKKSQSHRRVKSTEGGAAMQRRLAELGTQAIHAVPLEIKKKGVHNMTESDLEKVRDAIVIKTYTALIRKHSGMSEEEQLRELKTVRRFAKALYFNIRGPDASKTHLTLEDFKLFFDDPEMAQKAFEVFDLDNDGKLTRQEVRDRVISIYAERRNMARSLRDTDSIVQSLELSIGICLHFLFGAIYLTIWGVPLLEGFSAFSTTVLALTFIFGNSAKNAFESVLFLFFEHPYDVGDMVYFNGDSMRVKRISLMYTDFVKWTNEEIYIPNTKMMTLDVTNWTRTRTKFELHKILVDVGVPWDVKQDISNAIVAHCNANPNDFCGTPRVTFREVMDPLKVYLGIGFTYNFPPDDFDRLVPARDKVMYVVQSKLAEHKLIFSNHQINRLEASQELTLALQMRQLQGLNKTGGPPDFRPDSIGGVSSQGPDPRSTGGGGGGPAAPSPGGGLLDDLMPPVSHGGTAVVGPPEASGGGDGGAAAASLQFQPSQPQTQQQQPPVQWLPGGMGPSASWSVGLGTGSGIVSTSSALPALGAEGLQQRPAAAAAAVTRPGATAVATGAAAAAPPLLPQQLFVLPGMQTVQQLQQQQQPQALQQQARGGQGPGQEAAVADPAKRKKE